MFPDFRSGINYLKIYIKIGILHLCPKVVNTFFNAGINILPQSSQRTLRYYIKKEKWGQA